MFYDFVELDLDILMDYLVKYSIVRFTLMKWNTEFSIFRLLLNVNSLKEFL